MASSAHQANKAGHTVAEKMSEAGHVVGDYAASAAEKASEEARALQQTAADMAHGAKERAVSAAHGVQARCQLETSHSPYRDPVMSCGILLGGRKATCAMHSVLTAATYTMAMLKVTAAASRTCFRRGYIFSCCCCLLYF